MGDMADYLMEQYDDDESYYFSSGRKKRLVVLNFERVIQESKKAWHIEFPMDDNLDNVSCWLPKSQCTLRLQDKKIQVPEWLVAENDLEDYQEDKDND